MCQIKNKQVTDTLQSLRNFVAENHSAEEMAELFANVVVIRKELEKYEEDLKKAIIENGLPETQFFPELKKKVFVSDGKSTTQYDIKAIGDEFQKLGRLGDFYKVVNVVAKKVEKELDENDQRIIEKNVTKQAGKPYVTCMDLSATDESDLRQAGKL